MSWKIARLTPNDYCWKKPSGRPGKCQGKLFEAEPNNYGHEEWLNRNDGLLTLNDYRYAYIKGFRAECCRGITHDVVFYTKRCDNNNHIYSLVGYARQVQGLMRQEAADVMDQLTETGAIATMIKELNAANANSAVFQQKMEENPLNIFNVKFKMSNLKMALTENCRLRNDLHFEHQQLKTFYFHLQNLSVADNDLTALINNMVE